MLSGEDESRITKLEGHIIARINSDLRSGDWQEFIGIAMFVIDDSDDNLNELIDLLRLANRID